MLMVFSLAAAASSLLSSASPASATRCAQPWSGPHSTIDNSTGSARLMIDGKVVVPIWLKVGGEDPLEQGGPDRWAKVQFTLDQATAAGGVPIVAFATDRLVRNSSAYEGGTDWAFSDAHPFDNRTAELFDRIVAHAPTALLYPTVYPFFDHHGAQFSGPASCVVAGTPCDQVKTQNFGNASDVRVSFPNVPSAAWAGATAAAMVRLMCYLDERFPRKIFGVQLDGLETGEWFQPGMGGNGASAAMYADYSNATLTAWCTETAGDHPTECAIPTTAERVIPTVGNSLIGGASSRSATAFNQWLSKRTVQAVSTLARAAKQASGGAAFTAFYYGYLFELAGVRLAGSGHLAVGEFFRERAIDAMLSPYAYAPDARNFTMPLLGHGLLDSANLHGKLHIIEDDSRTGLCDAASVDPSCTGDGIVRTRNVEQMIAKARTNAVTAALRHDGLYFYDIPGDGWYGRPEKPAETRQFWTSVRAVRERYNNLSSSSSRSHTRLQPQVALLVDDLSAARFPLTGGPGMHCTDRPTGKSTTVNLTAVKRGWFAGCSFSALVHSQPQHALAWIGSPVRTYLLSDVMLDSFPAQSLRLVIFANSIQIPPAVLDAIKAKLTGDLASGEKRTLLWVWAPSVLDPSTGELDASGPDDLLGLGLTMGDGPLPLETIMADGSSFGPSSYAVSPWFLANREQRQASHSICGEVISTKVLGRYSHGGAASVIHANATDCNLLFSGSPGLPASTYRQLADAAGVHRFLSGPSSTDVVVEASGNAIFLHCGLGDAPCDGLTLHLPDQVSALFADDLDGTMPDTTTEAPVCTSCASVSCTALPPGGVRVYWLS
eukprot:SAG31_NODE_2025_length_6642_cov_6.408681_3_plen_832_part_00